MAQEPVDLTGASILFGPLLDPSTDMKGLNWEGAAEYGRAQEAKRAKEGAPELGVCQWFAGCERDAVTLVPHAAFPGGVPACQECTDFATG